MLSTTEFREGLIFQDENGQLVEIIEFQHHRKSQARAVVRVKLRNINTGAMIETAYRPEDKFNEVSVEKRPFQYLYMSGDMATFMNTETYDQVEVPTAKLGDLAKYLKDNMDATGIYINDQLFNVELPIKVPLKIASTVPGVKGDTVANTTKEATLETGAVIKVPLFINEGDTVLVDTRTGSYVERVAA